METLEIASSTRLLAKAREKKQFKFKTGDITYFFIYFSVIPNFLLLSGRTTEGGRDRRIEFWDVILYS